jgi:hypothetical protein
MENGTVRNFPLQDTLEDTLLGKQSVGKSNVFAHCVDNAKAPFRQNRSPVDGHLDFAKGPIFRPFWLVQISPVFAAL